VSYEPLHHKYRPQTFADLVGQDAITTTLSNAMRLRRIAPAYLLTGPRGTGKTSSARILAKSLNCIGSDVPTPEPCGVCEVCQAITRGNALDVIEIDAASNTGVDNIRELIERAQFAPVQCRYKIYCLDEVHMLSTAAFNALLKTLEEPPERVVFILATTDPQRVLPTIISRCQRFDFRRIPLQPMVAHLIYIAQQENIAIAPTAVELVAQISQGGLRDAESLLDQLSLLAGEITIDRVWDLVGSVPEQDLLALAAAIATANPEIILDRTRHLLDRGREPLTVLQNLTGFYRDLLIAKTAPKRRDLVALTEATWEALCRFAQAVDLNTILAGQQHLRTCEIQIKNTTQPRLWLEVTLLGLIPFTTPQVTAPQATALNLTPPSGLQPVAAVLPQLPQVSAMPSAVPVNGAPAASVSFTREAIAAPPTTANNDEFWPSDIAISESHSPIAAPP
jgi:DNA polymerase III subunit gamma/tau